MELVDRYLQAVRFWLPREQQNDIVKELADDIMSGIEEEQRVLGRAMTEAEIHSVLKLRGRPFVVAAGYLPQRHLIGPFLFPIYALVLKVIGLFYVLPWIIIWLCLLAFAPSWHWYVLSDLGGLWSSALQFFAGVTICFAIADRFVMESKVLTEWDPYRLPRLRVREVQRVSRGSSVTEIITICLFAFVWSGGIPAVDFVQGGARSTVWTEFHRTFYTPVLLMTMATIAIGAVNLAWPYGTRLRLAAHAATSAACAAIAAAPLFTHGRRVAADFVAVTRHVPMSRQRAMDSVVDAAVLATFAIITIALTRSCLYDLFRMIRWRPGYVATASST